jgi:UDPglucose 6-dehydrogenase
MDEKSAEMTKYAANAMLATRITFMNEVASLCDLVGADVDMVRRGIGSDPRIGKSFLFPGVGFGGSCFPKDVMALSKTSKDFGYTMQILEAVHLVNEAQKHLLAKKIVARFGEDLRGLHFGMWGLAFKPNTDDMREAPSRVIIKDLLARGATITAYDPAATQTAKEVLGDSIVYVDKAWKAADKADALLIVTEWGEFRNPDFELLSTLLRRKIIFDGRNLYEPARIKALGFELFTIGRGTIRPE